MTSKTRWLFAVLSLVLGALPLSAQSIPETPAVSGAGADPFLSAAGRIALDLFKLSQPPAGFALGSIQLLGDPPEALLATYYGPKGQALYLMEAGPEGMLCEDCPTVEVAGRKAPYETIQDKEGGRVVTLTLVNGGTGISLGLVAEASQPVTEALDLLKEAAGLLVPAGSPSVAASSGSPLREAARRAGFPVYVPGWLPEYFVLKSASYSPGGPSADLAPDVVGAVPGVSDEAGRSPQQVTLAYGDSLKQIQILVQPGRPSGLPQAAPVRSLKIGEWKAGIWSTDSRKVLIIDTRDALVCISGNVQEPTLMKVGRSLKRWSESQNER